MEAAKAALAEGGAPEIHVYRRRWLMLGLYVLALLFNAVPWMQYTVLTDAVTKYYGVGHELVEWTALVYNMTAMVLVLPAGFILDKYGLRPSILAGAAGSALGLWLRVLGCWPEHFWAVLAGHTILSLATNFLVSAPPRLAAVWFPANEVSSAIGASIIGQMGGVSIGCLVAPLSARTSWSMEENLNGFLTINVSLAVLATILLLAIVLWFEQAPPLPPSPSQAAAAATAPTGDYLKSVMRICRDGAFLLLLFSFNIILATYVAISTVLNRDIVEFFPDRAAETGYVASLLSLTGMAATFVFGIILDRTKRFKELSGICYAGSLLSTILWAGTIATCSMEVVYVVAGILGIFMTSYFIPAYEWAVELTYPEPEGNPTSILNWVMQPVSMVVTLVYSRVFSAYGAHAAHGMLAAMMAVGFVLQLLIPKRYRRREAELALARAAAGALGGTDKPLGGADKPLGGADKPLLLEEDKLAKA